MAELDERLEQLLADKETLKKVVDMASTLKSARSEQSSVAEEEPPKSGEIVQPGTDAAEMLRQIIANTSPSEGGEAKGEQNSTAQSAAGAAGIAAVLPLLLGAISGSNDLVSDERLNLIRAMKPYMANKRLMGIDRAIRMANMAVAAKTALGILGR